MQQSGFMNYIFHNFDFSSTLHADETCLNVKTLFQQLLSQMNPQMQKNHRLDKCR